MRNRNKEKQKEYNKKYYSQWEDVENVRKRWTANEDYTILKRGMSDAEISEILGRSIRAIQVRRCRIL